MGPLDLLLILVCLCLSQFTNFFLKKKRKKTSLFISGKVNPTLWSPREMRTCSPCPLERKKQGHAVLVVWRERIQLRDADRLNRSSLGKALQSKLPPGGEQSPRLCILILLHLLMNLLVCLWEGQHRLQWQSENSLWESVLSFGPMDARDQTQVIRLHGGVFIQ